jgi:hypothetical protein
MAVICQVASFKYRPILSGLAGYKGQFTPCHEYSRRTVYTEIRNASVLRYLITSSLIADKAAAYIGLSAYVPCDGPFNRLRPLSDVLRTDYFGTNVESEQPEEHKSVFHRLINGRLHSFWQLSICF